MIAETATTAPGKPPKLIASDNPPHSTAPSLAPADARPCSGRLVCGTSRSLGSERARHYNRALSLARER